MTDAPSVFSRVAAVIADMPAIGKDRQAPGQMGGYSFRGIEDITAALKPLLAKHGVLMVPQVVERQQSTRPIANNRSMFVVDLFMRFTFYGADGSQFDASMWGQGTDMGDKATQKAVTSAFKSMLSVTFCISDSSYDAEAHDVPESSGVHDVSGAPMPARPGATVQRATAPVASAPDSRADIAGGATAGPGSSPAEPGPAISTPKRGGYPGEDGPTIPRPEGPGASSPAISQNQMQRVQSKVKDVQARGLKFVAEREARGLPLLNKCNADQLDGFEQMLDDLMKDSEPFAVAK